MKSSSLGTFFLNKLILIVLLSWPHEGEHDDDDDGDDDAPNYYPC